MKTRDAEVICEFVTDHFDSVDQEDWFNFCEILFNIIAREMGQNRAMASKLLEKYPDVFSVSSQ